MRPEIFDIATRALITARQSRRGALAAFGAAVFATVLADKSLSRKRKKNRRNKKKNTSRNKNGSGGGCSIRHSEQEILKFISSAAKKYGQSENAMVRVARCESTLNPCAVNSSGPYYGLFQYLKSTWKSTPYGDRDIFDPEAQALATGWMWKEGRKNEWACQ